MLSVYVGPDMPGPSNLEQQVHPRHFLCLTRLLDMKSAYTTVAAFSKSTCNLPLELASRDTLPERRRQAQQNSATS